MARREATYRCTFCRRGPTKDRRLLPGPRGMFLCNECITLYARMLAQEERAVRVRRLARRAPRLVGLLRRNRSWMQRHLPRRLHSHGVRP